MTNVVELSTVGVVVLLPTSVTLVHPVVQFLALVQTLVVLTLTAEAVGVQPVKQVVVLQVRLYLATVTLSQ